MGRKRAELVPLLQILAARDGDLDARFPPPQTFAHPFDVEFFVPGTPKAKGRAIPGVSKSGKAFARTDPATQLREDYVREEFLRHVSAYYRHLAPYLPITAGAAWVEIYSLMPPTATTWAGKHHTSPPDGDNLYKLVKDALSGRAAGRPPLAFSDDCRVLGAYPQWKSYWEPERMYEDGYPTSPGTHVAIHFLPAQRDPKHLPAGAAVCPHCGRDDFPSLTSHKYHVMRCPQAQNRL